MSDIEAVLRVGNGINWKGQVFPKMDNYTAHNRMTGVGNALKRHYMMYLLEYEEVCPLCPCRFS